MTGLTLGVDAVPATGGWLTPGSEGVIGAVTGTDTAAERPSVAVTVNVTESGPGVVAAQDVPPDRLVLQAQVEHTHPALAEHALDAVRADAGWGAELPGDLSRAVGGRNRAAGVAGAAEQALDLVAQR